MIEYNPSYWQSTTVRRCFVYAMMYNEIRTIQALSRLKLRIIDKRFYTNPKPRGERMYWGWVGFDKPIELWDAMEAGLVPIFRWKGKEK